MTKNIAIAEAYYAAMGEKNASGMEQYLHPDVQFFGPLAELTGRKTVLEAAMKFATIFKSLKIRAKFSSEDQVMLVYDLEFPSPIGQFPAAGLLTFQEGLISRIELFFDARPLEMKKEEIFSK